MASRRSIRAVFRVQCGKCGGWLSQTGGVIRLNPPSRDVGLYPGERAARDAAFGAGWQLYHTAPEGSGVLLCPGCKDNPLGIELPQPCPLCQHVHRGRRCGEFHCLCGIRIGD